ncbi:hypothetical protein D9613_004186 [Agrocybe pediades]|uniref:YABBY protein C-terminal domain-containing protein n=1 Tax=Agrocybe pediades TaxID=84607 RepID=A0A8H4VJB7_9AGAR|nr:hypothetical protein D9613_004186 [Agrocybe pediades]
MPPRANTKSAAADKPAKKTKSTGAKGTKKLSAFNKFIKSELARLKETEPDMTHQERFSKAAVNWKTAKENPKAVA